MSNEFKPMKFGCGRYVQAPGALEIVGREAAMLKSKKALIVGGKQALDSVGAKMEESLKAAGVEPYFYTMTSDCTYETLDYLQNTLIPSRSLTWSSAPAAVRLWIWPRPPVSAAVCPL